MTKYLVLWIQKLYTEIWNLDNIFVKWAQYNKIMFNVHTWYNKCSVDLSQEAITVLHRWVETWNILKKICFLNDQTDYINVSAS